MYGIYHYYIIFFPKISKLYNTMIMSRILHLLQKDRLRYRRRFNKSNALRGRRSCRYRAIVCVDSPGPLPRQDENKQLLITQRSIPYPSLLFFLLGCAFPSLVPACHQGGYLSMDLIGHGNGKHD